jgi:hypothetical protein
MDFDLMPIVRWTMVEGKWKYICISYGELSMLKKESVPHYIRPLNISEIKEFLFDIKTNINKNKSILPINDHISISLKSYLGEPLYINRNDLLC